MHAHAMESNQGVLREIDEGVVPVCSVSIMSGPNGMENSGHYVSV